jgi:hypothetical protein
MIARIATFASLPPDVSAEVRRNVLERFMPAIRTQDGFVAGYWLANADGTWVSFTVWESKTAMERGGERANATPLLPGQDRTRFPRPPRCRASLSWRTPESIVRTSGFQPATCPLTPPVSETRHSGLLPARRNRGLLRSCIR